MGRSSDSSITEEIYNVYKLAEMIFVSGRTWMDIFILTVIWRDWRKKKRLSTTDRILTLQGSNRIWLGCTIVIWFTLEKLCPWITQIGDVHKVLTFSFWYFISCNIWLTASLCSYYCVKIADFSHPFFIHLKRKLSGLESAWLLGSAILALASSLPFVFHDREVQGNRTIPDFFQNRNVTDISHRMMALHIRAFLGLGYVAPFSICAISAALLLFSLWRHHQRMLGSWGGHKSPQTNAHFQAVVTIFFLLVNSVVVFVSLLLLWSSNFERRTISNIVASALIYGCFSVESIISVWGNKKLKNELRRSWYFVNCRGSVS